MDTVDVLAAPLLSQLPVSDLGKAAEGDPSAWNPATLMENPYEALGFWPDPALAIATNWEMNQ